MTKVSKKLKGCPFETASYMYQTFSYLPYLIEACAAASLAIGTLNGEQLT
jgi:hypothetical protein